MKDYFTKRADELRSNLAFAPELKELIDESIERYETQQVQLDGMFRQYYLQGFGTTFENGGGQYSVVTRDASAPGKVRCTFFDARGFFGHSTRNSVEEVLLELCQSGYGRIARENTLHDLSQTPEFIMGNEAVALRHAINEGRLTQAEAELRYAELKNELRVA